MRVSAFLLEFILYKRFSTTRLYGDNTNYEYKNSPFLKPHPVISPRQMRAEIGLIYNHKV